MAQPVEGKCSESITFYGVDPATERILPTNLCGSLSGQHIYLSVKYTDSIGYKIAYVSNVTRPRKMDIWHIDATQRDYLAPYGCLQYYRKDHGVLESFNFNSGKGELLNNHSYSMCIAKDKRYCDVYLTSTNFNLGGSSGNCTDFIGFGDEKFCGSSFGNSGSFTCKKYEIHIKQLNIMFQGKSMEQTMAHTKSPSNRMKIM